MKATSIIVSLCAVLVLSSTVVVLAKRSTIGIYAMVDYFVVR